MDDLRVLQILDLSHNQISSLQGLESHDFLEVINLEDNKVMSYYTLYVLVLVSIIISQVLSHSMPAQEGYSRKPPGATVEGLLFFLK